MASKLSTSDISLAALQKKVDSLAGDLHGANSSEDLDSAFRNALDFMFQRGWIDDETLATAREAMEIGAYEAAAARAAPVECWWDICRWTHGAGVTVGIGSDDDPIGSWVDLSGTVPGGGLLGQLMGYCLSIEKMGDEPVVVLEC